MKNASLLYLIAFAIAISTSAAAEEKPAKKLIIDPRLGQRLYEATKLAPAEEKLSPLTTYKKPDLYKTYPAAKKIKLPSPNFKGASLEDVIRKRRSKRHDENFSGAPAKIEELSCLLFFAYGLTGHNNDLELRAAPSAGALYPIEIYLAVNNVSGLDKGIYHYSAGDHSLELIRAGDFREKIAYAVRSQPGVKEAAIVFIFSAISARTTAKYGLRGWRYVYMEVGYISENLYLEAASLGLSTTAMGAFYDEEINNLLGIDGTSEMALQVQIFGRTDEQE